MIYRNKVLMMVVAASAWMNENIDANSSRFAAAFAPALPKFVAQTNLARQVAGQVAGVGHIMPSNTWYVSHY